VAIGYDSVHIHKPDPFPVRAALEKLEYQASEAVFVGDSPHDIKSGNDAGVITIAALWGPFRRDQLEPYQPAYFLDDIKDLPPLLDRIAVPKAG
ncbi:MAG: HAD family hydrolase, partial [Thermoanaerobaculia bacterium]